MKERRSYYDGRSTKRQGRIRVCNTEIARHRCPISSSKGVARRIRVEANQTLHTYSVPSSSYPNHMRFCPCAKLGEHFACEPIN